MKNLLPAVKEKWHVKMKTIIIQHENTKSHFIDFKDQRNECQINGWNINFRYHLSNNRDLNVLNLDFFNSIQPIKYQQSPKNIDFLIDVVEKAFQDVTNFTRNNVIL